MSNINWYFVIGYMLAVVGLLNTILRRLKIMSATESQLAESLSNIQAGLSTLAGKVAAQSALIVELQNQISTGAPVTQEQLDQLEAQAQAIEDVLTPLTQV